MTDLSQFRPRRADPAPHPISAEVPTTLESLPEPEPKPKAQSKTWWGLLTTVGGIALMFLGMAPDQLDFLTDGFQLSEDLAPLLTTLGAAVAAWGIRKGTQPGARPVK